ncbi:hypothetical protein JJ528_27815 (plasmid) [Klebsiella pneumoniae]|uniref:hypothetical protein n=1 Tax=Kosakonia sp. S42 TaxID=2767458 RepID=UPI00190C6471|nr:hypothetical protein [Kosakonia sp. S42]EJV4560977.1 hypothetical protein [Salmonella enterica]MBK0019101.1 hypothetical protein [Kosakonia sp. S42]UMD80985.1 hypothetical protein JJ528_27815 [Klebsiella pneumoniae]
MMIDKIRYGQSDYILDQIKIGNYLIFRVYERDVNHKVKRGSEPKRVVKTEGVKILLEKKLYAGKKLSKIEEFIDEMKDCLTFIVFGKVKEEQELTQIEKEGIL